MRLLRMIAAASLLLCLLLPMGQSLTGRNEDATSVYKPSFLQRLHPQDTDELHFTYATCRLGIGKAGSLSLLLMVWPTVFCVVERYVRKRYLWMLQAVELILCGATIHFIYDITVYCTMLYGAFIAMISVFVWGFTTMILLSQRFRHRPQHRPRSSRLE